VAAIREAGVTAAVLVQRFGSKRGLLLALAERFSRDAGGIIDALAAQHASPLAALHAYAECMAGMAASPAAFARSLAYLQIDLTDPDFRRCLLMQARATRAGVRRLLNAARVAGEITPDAPVTSLARTLEAVLSGSLLSWAFYQEGTAAAWLRRDVAAVLAPYRAKSR